MLRLYNTLTRQKEIFKPLDSSNVRVYACGPTVYDHLHIGNGRMLIVFDVLFRLLRHIYGPDHVTYVRNITDVDDKINARAAERGVDIGVLTDEMTKVFHEDAKALHCLQPDPNKADPNLRMFEPRATDHITEMIALIERLIAKGHAYVVEGHVLFDVPSMPAYGRLSKRPLDEMIAGARVEVAPYKRSPMDFILWKPSSAAEPGWPSPWGRGRPGWHLECSAMSWKHLGEVFDIHGGGIDLLFPHHENEMAQSCSAFGHEVMANYWMHNGHLQVEGEKMAKSLGNFVTIYELLHTDKFGGCSWPGEVLRLAILKTHYRQPIDFTVKALEDAYAELQTWANQLSVQTNAMVDRIGERECGVAAKPASQVLAALSDDLNTSQTITELREMSSRLSKGDQNAAFELMQSCDHLGLLRAERLAVYSPYHVGTGPKLISPKDRKLLDEIQVAVANDNEAKEQKLSLELLTRGVKVSVQRNGAISYEVADGIDIQALMEARQTARKYRNWAEADRIRDELEAMGIALKDNKDGTTSWEVKR
ncbi:MAG: cysteine--tRNA ligase [Beijerinckiaceae bacterium]|nr:cysteine--tRNA ligase [Beijerinckiaceae bacterium]